MSNPVKRYTDEELEVFKALIEKKLDKASRHLASLQEQILEITENSSDEHGGDWVDDSSINNEVEMLNNMAIRQRMHIQDLQNALVRIRNKVYGICVVTGELIDRKRLMAVPTTTKSLVAKTGNSTDTQRLRSAPKPSRSGAGPSGNPKVITKIIRKSSDSNKSKVKDDDDVMDFDLYNDEEVLPDNLPDLDEIPDQSEEDIDL